jgi:CheY-like chemotaxis protein
MRGNAMKVLLADDDADLVRALTRWLKMWGYEPVPAMTGLDTVRALDASDSPRVVILDWDMPAPNGVEICRMLRARADGASRYVLMLTARQHKNDLIEALESGADDFLSKPFHPRELQLRLAKGVREAASRGGPETGGDEVVAGAVLGGKVRLERELARGAMGEVWIGVHLALGVNVAVKFMDEKLAQTAEYASFEREARAAAQLRSEHTVRIYDHGLARGGRPYLVMEYLDGESLGARVERLGRLSAREVVDAVSDVARALDEAHGRGIVHRDVKPENVLVVESVDRGSAPSCKLIDFGLARPAVAPRERFIAGTPVYMSPEYLRLEAGPTPALDIWALAVSAFEMLTGELPFDGDSPSHVLETIFFSPFPVASRIRPDVPAAFDEWFARACTRDASARFRTAGDLAEALRRALTEPSTEARSR